MEELPNNSLKSRENAEKEQRVQQVVKGKVTTKERSKFADLFKTEDAINVGSYLWKDVLAPAFKKTVSDLVTNGIDMILYGEAGHTKRSSNAPSYRSYYDDRDRRPNSTSYRPQTHVYQFNDIVLETKADAEMVLDSLGDALDRYGAVSVGDLYDLVGIVGNFTDQKYGWTDLRTARAERERDGRYSLRLPRPMPL